MAVYRNIHLSFWTDTKVVDDFTPEDKYFYLYLLTNPHTNICGCYEISCKQMERETGYSEDTVKRLLERMQNVHDVLRYDLHTKEVLILNWHKYNWSKSMDLISGVISVAENIKSPHMYQYVMESAERFQKCDFKTEKKCKPQKKDCSAKNDSLVVIIQRIISYLNVVCGTSYRASTPKTISLINARLNEKFTEDDFYTVIDKKASEWKGTDMARFLRPETLFSNKFEGYLNQIVMDNKTSMADEWRNA